MKIKYLQILFLIVSNTLFISKGYSQEFIFNEHIINGNVDRVFAIFATDIDGDGDFDIISANWNEDTVTWFENLDGKGTYSSKKFIDISTNGAHSVYAADIDGDGDMDVLCASIYDDTVAWYENKDGKGDFGAKQIISSSADGAVSVYATDIDGDNDIDVLSASTGDDTVAWYENLDGSGNFSSEKIIYNSVNGSGANSVVSEDLDNDQDKDVIIVRGNIFWYENVDGNGTFEIKEIINDAGDGAYSVFAADIDGDNDIDIISSGYSSKLVAWYENIDGEGTFGNTNILNSDANGAYSVHAADIDLDGDIDIINSNAQEGIISWYENTDGQGSFGGERIITNTADGNRSVYASDVDGDGDLDIISANESQNEIAWYENRFISNDSLIAFYRFNGNADDESDNNYDGQLVGNLASKPGRYDTTNESFQFGPESSYIELPSDFIWNNIEGVSISVWLKPFEIRNEDLKILDLGDSASRYFLEFSDSRIKFGGEGTRFDQDFSAEAPIVLTPNEWVHLVAIIDTANQESRLYKNGVLIAASSFLGELRLDPSNDKLKLIGARQLNLINQFHGTIDEIKVNGYVYSDFEITIEYKNYHAPDTLQAEVGRDDIILRWSSDRINSLNSYYIYRDGNLLDSVNIQSVTDTVYIDTNTIPERKYLYHITSVDSNGYISHPSDTINALRSGTVISEYSFSGNVNDSSGYGFHGTNNGATYTKDRFGNESTALFFDGIDDYVTLPSTISVLPEDAEEWSVSVWFNSLGLAPDEVGILSDYSGNDDNVYSSNIKILGDGQRVQISYKNATENFPMVTATDSIEFGSWYHIVHSVSRINDRVNSYINGQIFNSTSFVETENYIEDVARTVGALNEDLITKIFWGSIDDISIYSKALNEFDINQLYANYHAPDSLLAEARPTRVDLSWNNERYTSLRSYQVYRDGVQIDTVNNDRWEYYDQNVEIGTTYNYYITSVDTLGNVSQPSDTVTVTVPDRLNDIAITKVYPEAAIPGNRIILFVSDISSASELEVLFGDTPTSISSRNGSKLVVEVPDIETGPHKLTVTTENSIDTYINEFTALRETDKLFGKELILSDSASVLSLEIADLNSDGFRDIIYTTIATAPETELIWLRNIDGFNYSESIIIDSYSHSSRFDLSDVDNDGDIDIILVATSNSPDFEPQFLRLYLNNGDGNFLYQDLDNSIEGSSRVHFSDINLDGHIDVLAINNWSGTSGIYLYENQGNLNFREKVNIGLAYQEIQTLDLDNDGDLDILPNRTYWLKNVGNNTFDRLSFEDGNIGYINAQAFADFDKDGFEDLILFSSGRDHLSYFRNKLSDSPSDPRYHFELRRSLYGTSEIIVGTNYDTYKIETGDFNGDGKADVIVPFVHNDSVFVWFGNLNNDSFSKEQFISSGYGFSFDLESADLDNDGDLDIVASSFQNSKFSIIYNLDELDYPSKIENLRTQTVNPDSAILSWNTLTHQTYETENYTLYRGLSGEPLDSLASILHIDNSTLSYIDTDIIDGETYQYAISATNIHNIEGPNSDTLLVAVPSPPRITRVTPLAATSGSTIEIFGADFESTISGNVVRFNNITANIVSASSTKLMVEVPETNFGFNRISVETEIDRDTFVDQFTRLIPIKGSITFRQGGTVTNDLDRVQSLIAKDMDNDGDVDVIGHGSSNTELAWFENQNSEGLFSNKNTIAEDINSYPSISVGDVDRDGFNDIVGAGFSWDHPNEYREVYFFRNYQDGVNFVRYKASESEIIKETILLDINQDGHLDIFGNENGGAGLGYVWYPNAKITGEFEDLNNFIPWIGTGTNLYPTDIDMDGDVDFFTSIRTSNTTYWIENAYNDLNDWFPRLIDETDQEVIHFVYGGDLNGDHYPDLISSDQCLSCNQGNTIVWYDNLGDGSFGPQKIISDAPQQHEDLRIIDLDADGDNDIVAVSIGDNRIIWHENLDGNGNFGPRLLLDDSQNLPNKIELADLDNDGDLDILVASSADSYITWFENISTPLILPSKVFGLATSKITPDSVVFSWSPVPEEEISHYTIYRGISADQLDSISTVQGSTTYFIDTEVEPNTGYWYTISGVSIDGLEGERSDTLQVRTLDSTPFKTSITTEVINSDIQVTWNKISNVGIQYYKIYRGLSDNQLDSLNIVDQSSGVDTTFVDSEVLTQITYWYSVAGVNYDGLEGARSDTISSTIPIKIPDKVESLSVREIKNQSIEFRWNEVNNTQILHYKVYRGFYESQLDSIGIVNQSSGIDTMFIDQNVEINQEYWYSVSAVSTDNVQGERSDTIFVEMPKFIPEIISGLAVTPSEGRSVEVSWNGTDDPDHSYYKVYRGNDQSSLDSLTILTATTQPDTVLIDHQVFRNSTYWYAVSGVNSFSVEGALSDTLSIMLDPIPFVVQSIKAKAESYIPSKVGLNTFELSIEGDRDSVAKYVNASSIDLLIDSDLDSVRSFNWALTDSSIIITPDSLFASESAKIFINSDTLNDRSKGEFYIDGNKNESFDPGQDNYSSDFFTVAALSDFDLNGVTDFDDFMLLASAWNTENYEYDIAPYLSREDGFPYWQALGDSTYDLSDLIVFSRYWEEENIQEKRVALKDNFSTNELTKSRVTGNVNLQISKKEVAATYNSTGGNRTIAYDVNLNDIQELNGIGIKLEYDASELSFDRVIDKKVFGQQSVQIVSHDSSNGILYIYTADFGYNSEINSELMEISFESNSSSGSSLEIVADLRYKDGLRLIETTNTIITEEDVRPTAFELFQNFPNPFNPSTIIQYALSEAGLTSLTIYTLTGQKVAELINSIQEPGYYSINWDAGNLASGMYIYRLESGEFIQTKRMVLIK